MRPGDLACRTGDRAIDTGDVEVRTHDSAPCTGDVVVGTNDRATGIGHFAADPGRAAKRSGGVARRTSAPGESTRRFAACLRGPAERISRAAARPGDATTGSRASAPRTDGTA